MITFNAFLTEVTRIAHPERLASNLRPYFRNAVCNALIDIQTFVPPTRDFHHDFFCQVGMQDFCNAGIFNGPRGIIQRVFAFKPGKDCRKFHYDRVSTNFIDCWIEKQRCTAGCTALVPDSSAIYDSPYCNYPIPGDETCGPPYLAAGQSEDSDCLFRNQPRYFAVGPNYRMFIAPRLPCGYVLCVHWQGIKRCYADSDAVLNDEDIIMAAARYAEAETVIKDRDGGGAALLNGRWRDRLKGIAQRFRLETELQRMRDCSSEAIDSLLPWFDPLTLDNPYDLNCNKPTDSTAPVVACDDVETTQVATGCRSQILVYHEDPNAEGLVPDDQNCPAIAYKDDGSGSFLQWNITTHVWQ